MHMQEKAVMTAREIRSSMHDGKDKGWACNNHNRAEEFIVQIL